MPELEGAGAEDEFRELYGGTVVLVEARVGVLPAKEGVTDGARTRTTSGCRRAGKPSSTRR
ncbi:MAG: hypothetical protein AVDCRST_MAG12-2933 [uncultured Rubrobacteraceae bacterium]|uniref:Uncharacterized protein n=1 Tax=uncultured Rubrobacteraceae bacterium TaxID=349277 RepID=A0A6J4SUA0_9ACTN|nr:MAG: hypothetical protein AVDCRST_MAG12-2933 [uncultured Rubrobacteraceae bacterium]